MYKIQNFTCTDSTPYMPILLGPICVLLFILLVHVPQVLLVVLLVFLLLVLHAPLKTKPQQPGASYHANFQSPMNDFEFM